jgi:hypothetical protein
VFAGPASITMFFTMKWPIFTMKWPKFAYMRVRAGKGERSACASKARAEEHEIRWLP